MKVEIGRQIDTNVGQAVEFSISKNASKLFALLGSYLYSQKEECVLHELCANGTDAHKMVGKENEPLQIVMPTRIEPSIKIRDYGPGLSNADVFKYLTTYGESNKQESNDFIGGWGIGSKSPAAVSDTWKIASHFEGVLTEYLVFINGDGIPSLTTIRSVPTEETGIEVSIPISESKFYAWTSAVQKVFKYYKVVPRFIGASGIRSAYPDPDKKTASNWWLKRDVHNYGHSSCSIVASNREYIISYEKLSPELTSSPSLLNLLKQPICLEMAIGEVELSVSREQLQYTKKTIDAIIARLSEIYTFYKTKFDATVSSHANELEYRELVIKFLRDNFGVSSNGIDSLKFIFGFINKKYNITCASDLSHVSFGLKLTKDQFEKEDIRVSNMDTVKRIKPGFNCWKSYCVTAEGTYDSSVAQNYLYDVRISINHIENLEFYHADCKDAYSRVRAYKRSTQSAKRFIVIVKNMSTVPALFKSKFKLASSLPKQPRAKSAKTVALPDSVYVIYQNSFRKVSFASLDRDRTAYVLTKSYVTVDGIDPTLHQFISTYRNFSMGDIIAVKDAKLIPKGHTLREMLVKCRDRILKQAEFKDELKRYLQDTVCNYIAGEDLMPACFGVKTAKDSIWNNFMTKYEHLKGHAPYVGRHNSILERVNKIQKVLGEQLVSYEGEDELKKDLQLIGQTYKMLKYLGKYGNSWKNAQVRGDILEYLEAVGK